MERLAGLIDQVLLFPPASMDMPAAVAEDTRARAGEHAWMLARFVCPAFAPGATSRRSWMARLRPKISAVARRQRLGDLRLCRSRRSRSSALPDFEPPGVEVFCEVPLDGDWRDTLAAVAAAGGKAKLRCGGLARAEASRRWRRSSPPRATSTCRSRPPPASITPSCPEREHGFLNFLTAADRAAAGADEAELRAVVATTDASELGTGSAAGRKLFVSIGSCSFAEPVGDLQALGVL